MPPAVAIAGVTAAASVGGAVLSSNAQKKAANQASDTATQTAQMNNDLAREIYGQNKDTLNPYVQRGNKAGDAINALLGLGGPEPATLPTTSATTPTTAQSALQKYSYDPEYGWAINPADTGYFGYGGINFGTGIAPQTTQTTEQVPAQGEGSAQEAAENAFDVFRNSTGYQFRLDEGQNALNAASGGSGVSRSGAAVKSLANYNQNMASNEFGNYMGYLSNQQGVGLSGASALAGVGQNYVNQVSANNNSAGTAAANAALASGQANANMWGGIANGIGTFLGSSFG